jgi:hypothetical protein
LTLQSCDRIEKEEHNTHLQIRKRANLKRKLQQAVTTQIQHTYRQPYGPYCSWNFLPNPCSQPMPDSQFASYSYMVPPWPDVLSSIHKLAVEHILSQMILFSPWYIYNKKQAEWLQPQRAFINRQSLTHFYCYGYKLRSEVHNIGGCFLEHHFPDTECFCIVSQG